MSDPNTGASVSQTGLSQAEPEEVSPLTGFDPSRLRARIEEIEPSMLESIVNRAADSFYSTVMESAEDYLRDNLDWNITSHIKMLERENERMRTELWEIDRKLGGNPLGQENRLKSIGDLQDESNGYYQLVWQVAKKYEGETRHETAMRYIKEREAASGIETEGQDGETRLGAEHESPTAESGDAQ